MLQALFAMLAALMLLSVPAAAQTPRETEIQDVISAQVEAFRRDDAALAYSFASPDIQELLRDPATFLAMVRRAYPEVYRPQSLRFLRIEESDGRVLQHVLVQGPDGSIVTAVYEMVEIDGRWRINGCTLVKGSDA